MHLTEGVDKDDRKAVVADLTYAVAGFLQERGQSRVSALLCSALLTFLQASYPLVVSTQVMSGDGDDGNDDEGHNVGDYSGDDVMMRMICMLSTFLS